MTEEAERVGQRLDEMYAARDIQGLSEALFRRRLWPGQARIAALTAFLAHKRAAVCCYTQYGKTFGIGTGLGVDLALDLRPRKVALVGPRAEQAKKVRQEFLGAALSSPWTVHELGLTRQGAERMKEKNLNRFVTRHGKEYRVLTTGKDTDSAGEALMGHGVDSSAPPAEAGELDVDDEEPGAAGLVVVTEAGLIPEPAWPKITRMLGNDGILIVEGNPWAKGTGFHRMWTAPGTFRIHIDVEQGIREGRFTRERADEERGLATPLHWTVLWRSEFPDTAEDQLIPWEHIQWAKDAQPALVGRVERRYGLDVAEGGADLSILTPLDVGSAYGKPQYRAGRPEATGEPDPLRIADWAADHMPPGSIVVVDAIGPGGGVASALQRKGFQVRRFKAGESARDAETYRDVGSEGYWLMRLAFAERRITITPHAVLEAQLVQPRWRADGKRVKVDKRGVLTKSPDYADSLMMAIHGGPTARKLLVGG